MNDVEAETPILWPPMRRADSFEKTLMLGKTEDRRLKDGRGRDAWTASLTLWTWVWVDSGSWWWTRRPGLLRFMGWQKVRHNWVAELNWVHINMFTLHCNLFSVLYILPKKCTYFNLKVLCCWKMLSSDNSELPQTLSLQKTAASAKHNKMTSACTGVCVYWKMHS